MSNDTNKKITKQKKVIKPDENMNNEYLNINPEPIPQQTSSPTRHELGQYFTTNLELKEIVYKFVLNKPKVILEPSVGQGDLVSHLKNKNKEIKFDMFEIDGNIKFLANVNKKDVIIGDFMKQKIDKKYKTIIGNPPYVRTKKGNLYIDFTEKCYNLLEEDGELIFIIPSDFFKLTSASSLLNTMITNGTFTHIYHPHNEKMFEGASIDVMIYRYLKNKDVEKVVLYNDKEMYITHSDGLITFNEDENNNENTINDYFDIYVGIVSGRDGVYKNDKLGNIDVLNGIDQIDKYIYVEKYPSGNKGIDDHLLKNKEELMGRGIRKFSEKNWFEWGAPRNITTIRKNLGRDCIYINNITRKNDVAFVGKVQLFGGGLIMLIPKKKYDLNKIVEYFNSMEFKKNFIFSGRFKIGHRQISNSFIDDELFEELE